MARSPATTTIVLLKSNDEKFLTKKEFLEIDNAIQREDFEFLQKYVKATSNGKLRWVNLSEDPLLNVMIAYGSKDHILLKLINMMTPDALETKNKVGDTVLHVAAAKDRKFVATALIEKNRSLIEKRNKNLETPLLKAAHFGSAETFKCLLDYGSNIFARNKYGSNVLHCAILGNNPDLALQIAQQHPTSMQTRNDKALTPLQLMVTIPEVFRSSLELGPAESLIYAIIPLNSHNESKKLGKRDEETPRKSIAEQSKYWVEDDKDIAKDDKFLKESKAKSSKIFLENCQRYVTKVFKRVKKVEEQKEKHAQTMKLIAYLARDPGYWDFIQNGFQGKQTSDDEDDHQHDSGNHDFDETADFHLDAPIDYQNAPLINPPFKRTTNSLQKEKYLMVPSDLEKKDQLIWIQTNFIIEQNNLIKELKKEIKSKKEPESLPRWYESPLIVGTKMGLHDYVKQILKVYPKSAQIKDLEGRNVLQVAIKHGHVKIVKTIADMTEGPNPVLPSWLLSDVKGEIPVDKMSSSWLSSAIHQDDEEKEDDEKKNTILHYAAGTTIKSEGLALQMRHEIKWFEMVKKLLPKDMVYSRNKKEKTAQELFDENHFEMVKSGKDQLMEIGKTCSSLLAAVVFATSFNIPGGKDSDNSTKNNMTKTEGNNSSNESVGFKVFTHAYMIGLSSATCSLILFLSLLTSNYRPEAFRKSLPTRCLLAGASFFCALMALLMAFLSNAYLTIYGGGKPNTEDLLQLVLELIGFPFLWAVVWFFGGFGPGFLDFILKRFRR